MKYITKLLTQQIGMKKSQELKKSFFFVVLKMRSRTNTERRIQIPMELFAKVSSAVNYFRKKFQS